MNFSHPGPMNIMEEEARVGGWEKDAVKYCIMDALWLMHSETQNSCHYLHRIDPVSLPECPGEKLMWFHPRSGAIGIEGC